MKEIERLAKEVVEKRRNEIFSNESQPTDPDWFIPVYEAGFREARELCAKRAFLFFSDSSDSPLDAQIRKIGEEEVSE